MQIQRRQAREGVEQTCVKALAANLLAANYRATKKVTTSESNQPKQLNGLPSCTRTTCM